MSLSLLDENSPIPLYHQLAEELKEKIQSGRLPPHALISSETELCKKYGVSRGTVRQAMFGLIRDGLVYRKPGQGTFVTKLGVVQPVSRFYSFDRDMEEKGFEPSLRVIQKKIICPSRVVKKAMELDEGEKVYEIVRIRFANEEPVLLDISYLLEGLFLELEKEDLVTIPLYELIMRKYRVKISRVREAFEPFLINKVDARRLNVPVGSLALLVKRTAYTGSRIFEFRRSIIRGDKCSYSVELI